MKPDLQTLLDDLRTVFPSSDPIERARALSYCRQNGLSGRRLADELNISEGSVRNYLLLLQLPPTDQASIKSGARIRPYLDSVRRSKKHRKQQTARKKAAEAATAAAKAVREIRSWFRDQNIGSGLAEQILLEAQALIRLGQQQGIVKPSPVAWAGPAARQFAAARPVDIDSFRGVEHVNGLVTWLARALVRLLPDLDTRDSAIYAALDRPTELGIG